MTEELQAMPLKQTIRSCLSRIVPGPAARFSRLYLTPINTTRVVDPFSFYMLHRDPLIIHTSTVRFLSNVFVMSRMLGSRRASFVVGFSWSMEGERARYLRREYRRHQRMFPQHALVFICNSQAEHEQLCRLGVRAEFVNKNAFLDENIYVHAPDIPKEYDALLNSRMSRFKRHYLARDVERLAVVTSPDTSADFTAYEREVRELLSHATWLNDSPDGYRRLPWSEVGMATNASRVGLILSKTEGQCRASMEYLLCGIPVVSTRSRGGRDVFFDDEFVAIVDDTEAAVADGVREMIERPLAGSEIREQTLRRIREHRSRFCRLVESLAVESGGVEPTLPVETWFSRWSNRLRLPTCPDDFADLIKELDAPAFVVGA